MDGVNGVAGANPAAPQQQQQSGGLSADQQAVFEELIIAGAIPIAALTISTLKSIQDQSNKQTG